MSDEYNGWTNRETWALALWIDNDQGLYEDVLDVLRENTADLPEGAEMTDYLAGEICKNWTDSLFDPDNYEGSLPKGLVTMLEDVGSLWRVNWDEIGQHYIETLTEE